MFHRQCSVPLRPQILLHHAATREVFFRDALFAADAFFGVNEIARGRDVDCALLAHALAFEAFPAGVEFADLVADLPLKVVVACHIHRLDFYGMLKTIHLERLERDYRHIRLDVEDDDFDLLVMGRTQGKGCYIAESGVPLSCNAAAYS